MDPAIIVLTTVPEHAAAVRLAEELIRRKLAACINILPAMTSVYEWKGALEKGQEHLLLIKTRQDRYPEVEACILGVHPYELPEVIVVSVQSGLAAYLAWIQAQTTE